MSDSEDTPTQFYGQCPNCPRQFRSKTAQRDHTCGTPDNRLLDNRSSKRARLGDTPGATPSLHGASAAASLIVTPAVTRVSVPTEAQQPVSAGTHLQFTTPVPRIPQQAALAPQSGTPAPWLPSPQSAVGAPSPDIAARPIPSSHFQDLLQQEALNPSQFGTSQPSDRASDLPDHSSTVARDEAEVAQEYSEPEDQPELGEVDLSAEFQAAEQEPDVRNVDAVVEVLQDPYEEEDADYYDEAAPGVEDEEAPTSPELPVGPPGGEQGNSSMQEAELAPGSLASADLSSPSTSTSSDDSRSHQRSRSCSVAAPIPQADPSTAQYYVDRQHEPLFTGSTQTVLQFSFLLMHEKLKGHWTDKSLDRHLRIMHDMHSMQDQNLVPPSLYILKKVLRCASAAEYEWHVCPNAACEQPECFEQLPQGQWRHHLADECAACGTKRFRTVKRARGTVIVAQKRFWYFGLAGVIAEAMFADATWCKLRTSGRDEPHSFYQSPEFARLCQATNQAARKLETSLYEVGFDFGQMFKFRSYSTGVLGIRLRELMRTHDRLTSLACACVWCTCADVPHMHRNKRQFCHPLIIIPGPSEPKIIDPYLAPLLMELKKGAPAAGGIQVTPADTGVPFAHGVLLSAAVADTPAAQKLTKVFAHSAKLGCGYCTLHGQHPPNSSHGMYFLGYKQPTTASLAAQPSQLVQRKCGEADIQYSDLQQQHRGILAENRPPGLDLKQLGCHGRSLLSTELPYTSRNNLHVIPLAHALCYGVMKDFLKYLCGSQKSGKAPGSQGILSSAAKKVMRQRAADIVPTLDFNRPYRDVLQSRGEWVMEEYLHFIETWAVHILAPYKSSGRYYQIIAQQHFQRMWELLRAIVLALMRPGPQLTSAAGRKQLQDDLMEYGALAEEYLGARACKYNLHLLACRAVKQAEQRGLPAYELEFWVENLVQLAKSAVRDRTPLHPDLLLVNQLLLHAALKRLKLVHGTRDELPYLQTYEERFPSTLADASRQHMDHGAADGTQLLGAGQVAVSGQITDAQVALERFHKDYTCDLPETLEDCQVVVYKRAHVRNLEVYTSAAYTAANVRQSHWAVAELTEGRVHMAEVLFYVHISLTAAAGAVGDDGEWRLAICNMYACRAVDSYVGHRLCVKSTTKPFLMAIDLTESNAENAVLKSKRVMCKGADTTTFLAYHHTFAYVDPTAHISFTDPDVDQVDYAGA